MVGERAGSGGSVAEVKKHQDLFVLGKGEQFVELVRVKAVDPAGVYTFIGRGKHEMRGYYGCVFYSRLAFAVGIGVDVLFVEGHYGHWRRIIASVRGFVDLFQGCGRFGHIDVLVLEILGCRS